MDAARRSGRLPWTLLVTATLVAQAPGLATAQPPLSPKSGGRGRPLVHHLSGAPESSLTISGPALSIGGGSGGPAYEFSMIAGVTRLPDGRWAVGNLTTSEIRVYSSAGRFEKSMGRKGRGPGEFPFLWQLWRVGDTLIGADGAGLSQVFAADGTYLRSLPRPSAAGRPVERFGYLGDGSYVGGYLEPTDEIPGDRSTRWITLVRGQGEDVAPLQRYRARELARKGKGEPIPLVYGPRIEVAVLGRHYCAGFSDTFLIDCYTGDGKPVVSVRMEGARPPRVTARDRQVYFDGVDKGNPGPRGAKYREEVRAVTEFAAAFPAFGRLVPSTSEELWVGPLVPADATVGSFNPVPEGPTTWFVFNMAGRWVGRVELPARFRLMEAGADYVAGVAQDADEMERVVVYALSRDRR